MKMQVIIPTYRRADVQHTYRALPPSWQARTTFVVDEHDFPLLVDRVRYSGGRGSVQKVPPDVRTIAQKRAWILRELPHAKMVMMDDDLRFAVRTPEAKLVAVTPDVVGVHLHELEAKLDEYAHAGWSARQGNNRLEPGWRECARMMYVLGYRRDVVAQECELGRIETREDMDYTLQLLRKGYPNAVTSLICADQSYNAPGGASLERTTERSDTDAVLLAELHPGLVRVDQKAYKGSVKRKEVVVSWKKAYEQAPVRPRPLLLRDPTWDEIGEDPHDDDGIADPKEHDL